ncbi:dihydrofolate reductase family protein [Georgenia sp. Z1344]|uniref:dihydrofolate reductase family protein n=1 Tax=Georgenia sp. Z1344 TaxID=3416706 RepID=UPI003CF4FA4B
MSATYTIDLFTTLDGYGSYGPGGDWGGYWGKQGPELLEHRRASFDRDQRMVFGATTFTEFVDMLTDPPPGSEALDPWVTRMRDTPATVVSATLAGPVNWPDATIVAGDGVEVVSRLKESSDVPLRSHGSLTLNRSLLAAGLVDRLQVTLFPVVSGVTGTSPILAGAPDLDLELLESTTLDGRTTVLVYRPILHPANR